MCSIIIILALFYITIIIPHEYAHAFAMQNLFKFPIEEFSIGLGPSLLKYKKINFRLFPLGGFIRHNKTSFKTLALWKRIVVYIAGPLSNIILGICFILTFAYFNMQMSYAVKYTTSIISATTTDTSNFISDVFHLKPDFSKIQGIVGILGILTQQIKKYGWYFIIPMLGVLNFCIGLFQLLPIPGFDGGKILLDSLASLHPIFESNTFELFSSYLSFVLIITLFYTTTYFDVIRILK